MKYRKFGKLDWKISELSIGVLRYEDVVAAPNAAARRAHVDAIRYAIDKGVNYINLGYPLCFDRPENACAAVKEALADGYRDKVRVAVNISSRGSLSQRALSRALDEQLDLFALDRADFCVIDGVNRASWDALKAMDIASWAVKTTECGKAGRIGLSFHDDAHYLKEICDSYPHWAPVQLEFSILDYQHHPGVGGLKFTKECGAAVVATDITKAGRLLKNMPEEVRRLLESSQADLSMEERCLRWVLNIEEISSVQLSVQAELNSVRQVDKYLSYLDAFSPGDVDVWEMLDAAKIRETYYAGRTYHCTSCRRCMPCPFGVDAPRIIELVNDEKMFADSSIPGLQYKLENHHNIKCAECGTCDKLCPKRLPLQKIVNESYIKFAGFHTKR